METNQREPTPPRVDLERAVGLRVRALREARGLSQQQLGQKLAALGYPMEQPTVYKLEKGTRPIRVNEIEAVATIFGVDIAELLTPWVDEDHHVARLNLAKAKSRLDEANKRLESAEAQAAEAQEELERARAAREKAFDEWDEALAQVNRWITVRG